MRESGSTIENKFFSAELGLQMGVLGNTETITGVPEESQNLVLLEGYQCDKCGNVGTGRKADLVTHTSEILIFIWNFSSRASKLMSLIKSLLI